MVISYYIFKYPYKVFWHLLRLLGRNPEVVVYYADPMDYYVLRPVLRYMPALPVLVKNRKTARFFRDLGLDCKYLPSFPKAVIMCRHATHRFPEDRIVKIGFRHGAYHFKAFSRARYYNAFDIFFVTSQKEVELAENMGITSTRAIGFPKLDPAFNNVYRQTTLDRIAKDVHIQQNRKTIIFTATWDRSGMSAIEEWIDILPILSEKYNILVTVHPFTSKKYVNRLRHMKGVYYIPDPNVLPYLMISDVLVGDISSIIAEFCALDKPIIVFKIEGGERLLPEISYLLEDIAIRIDHAEQLDEAIERCLKNPQEKSRRRRQANQVMFDQLDGQAGKRAVMVLKEKFSNLAPSFLTGKENH